MRKTPWNKNKSVGQKKPLTPRQIDMLKEFLENKGKIMELALFSLGIDSMLRSSDLLKLKVEDVVDFKGKVKEQINIKQQKTKTPHKVMISKKTALVVFKMIKTEMKYEDDYLFTAKTRGGKNKSTPLARISYAKLVKQWCNYLHLDPEDYSTHSIRRTRAVIFFKETGNIPATGKLLGHKSIASTSAYLGVDQAAAFDLYGKLLD